MDEEFTDEAMKIKSAAVIDLWTSADEETRELITRRKIWT